jgi:hypothetical protein
MHGKVDDVAGESLYAANTAHEYSVHHERMKRGC